MDAMRNEKVRRIPIVDERGSLVGIVSQADVVRKTRRHAARRRNRRRNFASPADGTRSDVSGRGVHSAGDSRVAFAAWPLRHRLSRDAADDLPVLRRAGDGKILLELRRAARRRHLRCVRRAAHARREVLSPLRHAAPAQTAAPSTAAQLLDRRFPGASPRSRWSRSSRSSPVSASRRTHRTTPTPAHRRRADAPADAQRWPAAGHQQHVARRARPSASTIA